jgi:hypothetical protein
MARVTKAVTRSRSHRERLLRKARFIKAGQKIAKRAYRKPYHVDMGKDNERKREVSAWPHVNEPEQNKSASNRSRPKSAYPSGTFTL